MLKYITLFAALGAVVLAQDSLIDDLLEQEMQLPCAPKPCVPICKPVTKYTSYGAFKLPYTQNVCADDKACLTANAKCIATLLAAMKAAEAAEKDMIAKAKLANSAKATKADKDAAAAAKKVEEAKAKAALDAGKAALTVAEKETATAKAALARSDASFKAKKAVMNRRLKEFETAKAGHLAAQKAYANAKGDAAKAADAYNAAVKAHCDAEAVHATAVKYIGHGHFKKDECKKQETPARTTVPAGCFTIRTKSECCSSSDGRAAYASDCVPGSFGDNVCEPQKWVTDNKKQASAVSCFGGTAKVIKYIGAHPYVYATRASAATACKKAGYAGLCSKAQGEGFERCGAGWYSDYKGYWMSKTQHGCSSVRGWQSWGHGKAGAYCCSIKYKQGAAGTECALGTRITNKDECLRTAANSVGVTPGSSWVGSTTAIPVGCSIRNGGDLIPHWNTATSGTGRSDLRPICKTTKTEQGAEVALQLGGAHLLAATTSMD